LVPEVYERLQNIGVWMKVNNEAIYNSLPLAPYQLDNFCFTRSKDGNTLYIFCLQEETKLLPAEVELPDMPEWKMKKIRLLGYSGKLTITSRKGKKVVMMPEPIRQQMASTPALVFVVK
jgi:alpha-L-fucosidase